MRNLFVVMFLSILLAGGGNLLWGQDTTQSLPPTYCDCNSFGTNINFEFIRKVNGEYNNCFELKFSIIPGCDNYVSVILDFSDFPPCLGQAQFYSVSRLTSNGWVPVTSSFQIPSSNLLPLKIYGGSSHLGLKNIYRFCPNSYVDCGGSNSFKIKYKLTLRHMNANGTDWIETDCDFKEASVNYIDELSNIDDNPNYKFTFSPIPVKNILNISCNTLKNFNLNIFDLKGTLISKFKNLSNNSSIDLSCLIKGVYNIQIIENEIIIINKKFTKE